MKAVILLFLILFANIKILQAQEQEPANPNLAISWFPQLMYMNGLRIDVDIHLGKSTSWLILSPQFYLRERLLSQTDVQPDDDDYGLDEYKKLKGYGISLSHRIFFKNNNTPFGIYLGYGGFYNHYELKYEVTGWGSVNLMGLNAITYGDFEHKTEIDKFGPDFYIGYQAQIIQRVFVDFFCGGGLRYSLFKTDNLSPKYFDNSFIEFGYTGTVPLAGIRIGVLL